MNLSFKHYYWRWIKNLLILAVICIVLLSLARLGFAWYFGDWSTLVQDSSLKWAFFLGLRFDLILISYIHAIPFILINLAYFLPGKTTIKRMRFLVICFLCFGYFALAWLYLFDYAFFSYFQDHLNILFFGFFEDDTKALLISLWKNYNMPFWMGIFFGIQYGIYRLVKLLFSPFDFDLKVKRSSFKMVAAFIFGLVILAFFGRGNFTRLPLTLEDAHFSQNEFINKLSLNGGLTFNRAVKIRKAYGRKDFDYLKKFHYSSWQEAFQDSFSFAAPSSSLLSSLMQTTPFNPVVLKHPPHVVLVVMESFGSYWNDHQSEEFQVLGHLDHHFKSDILFKNFLSAENGTIGSIVSVANSQVIRPGARFLSESDFMKTALKSSGHLPYKNAGYETHFLYGGKLGWRDLGKYLLVQGYDRLWGADEIKEAMPELNNVALQDLGNEWGIFDEYLYSFLEEQLRTATKPQFFLVLTTSNHPPFEYPTTYRPQKLVLTENLMRRLSVDENTARKRFLGLQYANQKTGEFLTRVKSSSLKDKTVVALTGDHSYWITKSVDGDEEFKRYAVPFYLYLPESLKPKTIDLAQFGSHEDIFPTLYHVTLSQQKYVKLGENLFMDDSIAMNSSGLVANREGAFHHGKFWKWKNQTEQILEKSKKTPELLKLKKHARGMISITDLYLKEEKLSMPIDAKNDRP